MSAGTTSLVVCQWLTYCVCHGHQQWLTLALWWWLTLVNWLDLPIHHDYYYVYAVCCSLAANQTVAKCQTSLMEIEDFWFLPKTKATLGLHLLRHTISHSLSLTTNLIPSSSSKVFSVHWQQIRSRLNVKILSCSSRICTVFGKNQGNTGIASTLHTVDIGAGKYCLRHLLLWFKAC